ncbi:permease of the drug/metabolite transporter (DMT) superfamily [Nonlabens ulvanivorans]|nr:permease of the drug/metabolite transporter (DMT) superfamily [Nonlabens ulvanivorans]
MDNSRIKYIYLVVLSLIWGGTSFILIKKALGDDGTGNLVLQPLQLGAGRTIISGCILIAIGWKSFAATDRKDWKWLFISGLLGTFFSSVSFCICTDRNR